MLPEVCFVWETHDEHDSVPALSHAESRKWHKNNSSLSPGK